MSFFSRLFGFTRSPARPPAAPPPSQLNSVQSSLPASTHSGTRRELLRVVLRDTLSRHGIPASWVSGEVLMSTSRSGVPRGVHWRLVVKHWDPRLLTHGIAFQHSLIKRVTSFDPMASHWLSGISWQFELPDESLCPPMPHPGTWTSDPHEAWSSRTVAVPAEPSGDVIAGPVRIADTAAQPTPQAVDATKADLEQLFAVRDADFQRNAAQGTDATQAMFLKTQPAQL